MAQGYTLLHDPNNAVSTAFLALYGTSGAAITGHDACVAAFPNIQGFPTVVYQEAQGANHFLYAPPDMSTVTAWRTAIDNPPATSKPTVIPLAAFLMRFTDAQLTGIQQATSTDPLMQVYIWRANTTPGAMIDLTNQEVVGAVNYAAGKGYGGLTAAEATMILTP
jgi:hypothetical protein